ncbi:MAG: cbb3-type cytochrome c oxidase subunit 3 [Azospirillaceae bacterium]|nr:cbb3-type cytochrome c oxidase subunit 3 [Azospirillaceae bacterium]
MEELQSLISQVWLVWFLVLFSGILVWAYWPSRRARLNNDCAKIPLLDDAEPLPLRGRGAAQMKR